LACDVPDSRISRSTFDGNKELILFAAYSGNAASVTIQAFADVPAGTEGTMEMTGPFHMRCKGQFRAPDPGFDDPNNLPYLDLGIGHDGTAGIQPPRGNYTAVVTIPSKRAEIRKSFSAGGPPPDPPQAVDLPPDCTPVADTKQQLNGLLSKYTTAVLFWIARMDVSSTRSQLSTLAAQASDAVSSGDHSIALDKLTQIRDIVQALSSRTYPQSSFILKNAHDSIALLTQPAPSS
jgi:hypothetical protein